MAVTFEVSEFHLLPGRAYLVIVLVKQGNIEAEFKVTLSSLFTRRHRRQEGGGHVWKDFDRLTIEAKQAVASFCATLMKEVESTQK